MRSSGDRFSLLVDSHHSQSIHSKWLALTVLAWGFSLMLSLSIPTKLVSLKDKVIGDHSLINAVPGAVSNFIAKLELFSVVFDWDPPQEPNGIVVAYELTYTVVSNDTMAQNLSTTFTELVVEFPPGTHVSDISIRAFNSVGAGPVSTDGARVVPCKLLDNDDE